MPLCQMPSGRSSSRGASRSRSRPRRGKEKFQRLFNEQVCDGLRHLAFSQRRFDGYRGVSQFDKKRILIAGKKEFAVHEYDPVKRELGCQLVSQQLGEDYEIVYFDFLEDLVPKYILIVENDTVKRESYLAIWGITKRSDFFS